MPTLLKIAVKNLLKNKRRNLIIGSILFFSAFTVISGSSFLHGVENGMRNLIINSLTGHLQIRAPKYPKDCLAVPELNWELIITNPEKAEEVIKKESADVKQITRRIVYGAGIYKDETFVPVKVVGVDTAGERAINSLIMVTDGNYLSEADRDSIALNKGLANRFDITVGDEIDILGGTPDGDIAAKTYYVKGIIEIKGLEMFSGDYVHIHIKSAQEFMDINNGICMIVIRLYDMRHIDPFKRKMETIFHQNGIHLKIDTWKESGGIFNSILGMVKFIHNSGKSIQYSIIIIGIINSILMSVFERTREIGTLMALGTTRYQVLRLFIWEMEILAITTTLAGIIAGVIVSLWFGKNGIAGVNETMAMIWGGGTLYPQIIWSDLAVTFFTMVLITLIGTLYPAWIAARKNPVDALRYV